MCVLTAFAILGDFFAKQVRCVESEFTAKVGNAVTSMSRKTSVGMSSMTNTLSAGMMANQAVFVSVARRS